MPVGSMTGFARYDGVADDVAFAWELRSVNGKGLEIKFRLPQGFESLDAELRKLAAVRLSRGNVQAALTVQGAERRAVFTINETMLADVLALSDRLVAAGHAVTPTADGILAIRGVVETVDPAAETAGRPDRTQDVLDGFRDALRMLSEARLEEGASIADALRSRLADIERLVQMAEVDPSRQPAAIRERLRRQIAALLEAGGTMDETRLHQEAVLLATRADISEELDRLKAHLTAANKLLDNGGPVGRRLDFLSQEFNREANTLCSKSNAASLTEIGLELKVTVDQFREQVQNIE